MPELSELRVGDIVRWSPTEDRTGERLLDHYGDIPMRVISANGLVHAQPLDPAQLTEWGRQWLTATQRGYFVFARFRFAKDDFLTAVYRRRHGAT